MHTDYRALVPANKKPAILSLAGFSENNRQHAVSLLIPYGITLADTSRQAPVIGTALKPYHPTANALTLAV